MRIAVTAVALTTFWGGWVGPALSQPPVRGGAGQDRFPVPALLRALDTDGDGEISAAERQQAAAGLLSLDRNGDGKLTRDELLGLRRPGMGPGPGRRADAPAGLHDNPLLPNSTV